jgi:transposase-like protein
MRLVSPDVEKTGIAHHFGVAEATLSAWSMQADVKDAVRPDQIESDAADR